MNFGLCTSISAIISDGLEVDLYFQVQEKLQPLRQTLKMAMTMRMIPQVRKIIKRNGDLKSIRKRRDSRESKQAVINTPRFDYVDFIKTW